MQLWIAAVAVLVVGLAIIATLGSGLQRSLRRRFAALQAGTGALAAGDFGFSFDHSGTDRLAELAGMLATAADNLKSRFENLEGATRTLAADRDSVAGQRDEARARLADVDGRQAQFLADIGHELRTPLTILRGEADVALRGPAEPTAQRAALERIQGQARELGTLLEEMIGYARSDGDGQGHAIAESPLAELVHAAAQEGKMLAEAREITLLVRLGDDRSRVEVDFRRLRQALLICIDNAVRHSPPGGRVVIETARAEDVALIRILDDGPGVAPEDRPRVFERFFRGHGEAETLSDGLGIGLAIAKAIIDRHSGTIRLDNRSEGGAVLEITLPIAESRP